mmetsp:Transcript_46807/g.131640  ORF Transcript_46807/g.131640 Transcript_46807/m.131640 type:complete len:238 (+) Transcript_46807:240-953(+)
MPRESHGVTRIATRRLQAPGVERLVGATELLNENQNRGLGGLARSDIAAVCVDAQPRLVARRTDLGEGCQALVGGPIDLQAFHAAHGRIRVPLHRVGAQGRRRGRKDQLLATHLVRGQGPRLVRADDRRAAERLHRWQLPDDGVPCGHLPGAQREARRHHCREALGDRSHRQRDCDLQVVDAAANVEPTHGVVEVPVVDDPHDCADQEDHLGQQLSEIVQLLLQRCLLLLLSGINHG